MFYEKKNQKPQGDEIISKGNESLKYQFSWEAVVGSAVCGSLLQSLSFTYLKEWSLLRTYRTFDI